MKNIQSNRYLSANIIFLVRSKKVKENSATDLLTWMANTFFEY